MVYTERTDKYLTTSKDNAAQSKAPSSSSSTSTSSSSSSKTSSSHSSDKWKYNNMVKDNRDKFNSLHFS
ncbi:hypothetical protein ACLKA6_013425 [Drosophila palustris]